MLDGRFGFIAVLRSCQAKGVPPDGMWLSGATLQKRLFLSCRDETRAREELRQLYEIDFRTEAAEPASDGACIF
jgi:hypothetical protein